MQVLRLAAPPERIDLDPRGSTAASSFNALVGKTMEDDFGAFF